MYDNRRMRIYADRRSCRANTAVDKFASVERYGRRRTTVSRQWEAIKTLNSHFRPGKKVVLERQPKGEKIGVNGIRNASREYIKSAWIMRKWTDRDAWHGSLWWKRLAIMRVRCARGTSCCRCINAARVPVYSSPCQEGATNHRRWYTAVDLVSSLWARSLWSIKRTYRDRKYRSRFRFTTIYIFVSGEPSHHSLQLFSAILVSMISISLE